MVNIGHVMFDDVIFDGVFCCNKRDSATGEKASKILK
jgi:sensor domain CHASE-containing protein